MSDRVEALKAMLVEDPNNSFVRYGLAIEYMKAGQHETAVAEFRALLEKDANYAAAYFHGGQTLERMGLVEEAKEMYERGIEATTRTGDSHTRSELQAALDLLPL
jgi:tetratricopeptide (TPR) repeat protein